MCKWVIDSHIDQSVLCTVRFRPTITHICKELRNHHTTRTEKLQDDTYVSTLISQLIVQQTLLIFRHFPTCMSLFQPERLLKF